MRKLVQRLIRRTLRLPLVSAMKPHKWQDVKTPRKLMEESRPFWGSVNWRSHWAAGMMNIISIVSIMTHIRQPPVASSTNK